MKKIIHSPLHFLLILSFCFLFIGIASAQRPKSMSKDAYKAYKKQAKSGDAKAMLRIADAHKGDMFISSELKNYKNALKWYNQVLATNKEKVKAAKGLFEIYLLGDKYIPKNIDAAKKWLQVVADSQDVHMYYQDNTDLYLVDIFEVYREATKTDASAESQFMIARYFLEFEIDYNTGIAFLDKAMNTDSSRYGQDANYIKSKWQFFRNRRSEFVKGVPFEYQKGKAHQVMKRCSDEGSELAKLEYANYIVHESKKPQDVKEETEKLLRNFVVPKFANKEQQLKAMYLVAMVQGGKQHVIVFRKLYELKNQNFSQEQFSYMDDAINEYKEIATQLETLTGLGKLSSANPIFSDIPLKMPEYYQHYQGDIRPLVAVKNAITTDENLEFLTPQNVERYKQTLLEQVEPLFQKADTPSELYSFKNALEKDKFFAPLAKPYLDSLIQQKLTRKGLVQEDLVFEYEKGRLENTKFYNLEEGRKFIEGLTKRNDLDPELPIQTDRKGRVIKNTKSKPEPRKQALLRRAKVKLLEDIYGSSPTIKQIEDLATTIPRYSWLAPEGREWAVGLKGNSDSWFTGIIEISKTSTQYFYEIKRLGDSERFLMDIKSIRNNQSNNAYSTNISVEKIIKDDNTEGYNVTIFGAKYQTYGWKQSTTDFFRVICRPKDSKLGDAVCTGYMAVNRDKSFSDDFLKKHNVSSNSQKDAIRAVVRYFILEMHQNLGIR